MGAIKKQRGFILAATLWILAIMFIVVGIFHVYVQQKLQLGIQAKENLQMRLDRHATAQTLLYLLASSRMTRSGITFQHRDQLQQSEDGLINSDTLGDELWLDGTSYRGIDSAHFSLQDASGLLSINIRSAAELSALLDKYESSNAIRTQLINRLQDYIDANDLISLAGAETSDYARQQLPLPSNDLLRSEVELLKVMGWGEWLRVNPEFNWQGWLSVRRSSALNLNAMPESLLIKYFGLSDEQAENVLTIRRRSAFQSPAEFAAVVRLPLNLDEDQYRFFPSRELRISLWNNGGGQAQVISLQLTPNGLYGPWQVDYEYNTQREIDTNEPLAIWQTPLFGHTLGDNR
uniref:general secretion pathway protein GspK n=1 Tax=Cellvibrio fontiphilus TaxID=1815559 RepID=UPI002B4C0B05|nr:hypothetical protein [Cellvibrio fontiphilus]